MHNKSPYLNIILIMLVSNLFITLYFETIEVEIPNPNYNSSVDIQQDPAWAVVGMIGHNMIKYSCQYGLIIP